MFANRVGSKVPPKPAQGHAFEDVFRGLQNRLLPALPTRLERTRESLVRCTRTSVRNKQHRATRLLRKFHSQLWIPMEYVMLCQIGGLSHAFAWTTSQNRYKCVQPDHASLNDSKSLNKCPEQERCSLSFLQDVSSCQEIPAHALRRQCSTHACA